MKRQRLPNIPDAQAPERAATREKGTGSPLGRVGGGYASSPPSVAVRRPLPPQGGKKVTSERELSHNAKLYLQSLGCEVMRRNVGARLIHGADGKRRFIRFGEPGQSDLYGKLPDRRLRRFELEMKRWGERPTKKQLAWLKSQNDEHCVAIWVDNLDTLERIMPVIISGASVVYGAGRDYDIVSLEMNDEG